MSNILVIDDDQNILRLLEFALKKAGHTVTRCTNGVDGLAQAETQPPDLIVADVMMPKMTGYEFCKQARAEANLKDVPIIIFSARFQPIDKQTALDAGATDFLPKTISPDALVARITELLPAAAQTTTTTQAMVGLFSLRGGTGLTSLAVNLAIALTRPPKMQTALVDLSPFGGHAALMLGLRPTSSVVNALSADNDVTPDGIKSYCLQHTSGVQLLASPMTYGQELSLTHPRLEQLVTTLKSTFPFTILDIPHHIEPRFASSLQQFDKIALILSPDMPSLQSTAMALRGLTQLGITENKIVLVVNQIMFHNALSVQTIQKAIKRSILTHIPFEPDMTKAVNSGQPLLLSKPDSAAASAIVKLANLLVS